VSKGLEEEAACGMPSLAQVLNSAPDPPDAPDLALHEFPSRPPDSHPLVPAVAWSPNLQEPREQVSPEPQAQQKEKQAVGC
jgi:hypothetical protein